MDCSLGNCKEIALLGRFTCSGPGEKQASALCALGLQGLAVNATDGGQPRVTAWCPDSTAVVGGGCASDHAGYPRVLPESH